MNIIANSCVGAALQRDCIKQKYENPFCWCTVGFNSMYYLIENFEKINFNNFKLIKNDKGRYSIRIEDKIQVNYPHYKFGEKDKKIRKQAIDIFYYKIWEFIVQKYIERLKRMKKLNNKPIFVLATVHKEQMYTGEQIRKICELCTKKNYRLIVSNNTIDFSKEFPNVKFFKNNYTIKDMNNVMFAKVLYNEIKDYLK